LTDRDTGSVSRERKSRLVTLMNYSEKAIYYGAALALLVTVVMLFVSVVASLLAVLEVGPLETALTILDRVLLVGLIAVVRRILLLTAEAEQTIGTQEFQNLIIELGVLTALVISLAAALYFTNRMESRTSRDHD
jgi:hypothetical protein